MFGFLKRKKKPKDKAAVVLKRIPHFRSPVP